MTVVNYGTTNMACLNSTSDPDTISMGWQIRALSLAKDCYSMKLDLLTNATVVDDAIRFVASEKSREKLKSSSYSSSDEDERESNESNYEVQQEEEGEEHETAEMQTTINRIF